MVIDRIENYRHYAALHPLLEEGVQFALSLKEAPAGRYDKGAFFVLVQEGETLPLEEGLYETHKRYWDLQIVAEGEELVQWQDVSLLEEEAAYSEEKDMAFWKGEGILFPVSQGMFYLAMPQDAHMPCRTKGEPQQYRKLVLKLPVPGERRTAS